MNRSRQASEIWCAAVAFVVVALLAAPAFADDGAEGSAWESRGEIAFEGRVFEDDDDSRSKDAGAALAARVDARYGGETVTGRARIFGRADQVDPSRSQAIVEEAWAGFESGDFQLRLGAQLINWTATEAFHPADILNSRNLDSNIENPEKIGEPMALVTFRPGSASFQAFAMPAYMRPFYPASSSRLSFAPAGISVGKPIWVERDGSTTEGNFGMQWGARAGYSFEGADLALHFVRHQDRSEPLFVPADMTFTSYRPVFLPVTQVGGTYQQALGGLLIKLEAAHRMFDRDSYATPLGTFSREDHTTVAAGLEYGWSHESGSQSTFLLEGQSIFGASDAEREELSPFQRDVLVGYRFAFNDELSREAMASLIWDAERTNEYLLSLSYGQRLNDTWSIKGGLRKIHAPPRSATPVGLQALDRANQVYLNLTRSF